MPGVVANGVHDKKSDSLKSNKKDTKVKKKRSVSCLQCIKPGKDKDGGVEGKYRVAAPELMQDTFMSDSEDEGGEVECPIQQQQQYRYMNSEVGTLHRAKPLEDSVTDGHLWPSNNDRKIAPVDRQPLDIGFLVSFVVDARGGAMKAKRRGGVRIIVPPAACAAPTRVTCRAATKRAPAAAPPPLMEGEALASRLLELQPQGAKFLAPVIIEVPIFTSSCREREIVILRSDTGETWQDHYLHNNDNPLIQETLTKERQEYGNTGETLGENGERVTRIVTTDFPHYLAVVSRVRQEVHIIGPEGGTVSSAAIPQVQALFPPQALTKRIRVGLQAHGATPDLCRRVLPRHVAVSPVLTVEPRRRKFHRSITLTAPLPSEQGIVTEKPSAATAGSNLRLLCSIMGGQARAVWEDVTGSTPLTITDHAASFTTTVSARFWLMNCQNVSDATKLATDLYREMLLVPFEVRIVVLGKRLDSLEGRLLVLYITDRYNYDTLLQQEHYTEVAASTSVRLLDGKDVFLEFSGNLVPVTKSGTQPTLHFEAFKDNRVEFPVRVKHHEETPTGRIYFMNEPKVPKGEQSQSPACVLDVELPDRIAPRAGKSQLDYLNLDQSGFDALHDELSFHWGDPNNSLGPCSLPNQYNGHVNGHDKIVANGDVKPGQKEITTKVEITEPKPTPPPPVVQNGDSGNVDTNKTKATFDSDEDKTPSSTLEKNKKKSDHPTSFLGGLADKVKQVFVHDDDDDKEKSKKEKKEDKKDKKDKKDKSKSKQESPSPKQPTPPPKQPTPPPKQPTSPPKQPTPPPKQETPPSKPERHSPPKPAPRLIKEDLLERVDDVFKDLHGKPKGSKDDDYEDVVVKNEDYATKLQILEKKAEEMYKDAVPVEEEICVKKKIERRRQEAQEEFENLIGKMNYDVNEKGAEIKKQGDEIENNLAEELDFLNKEKENLECKTKDVSQDVVDKYDKVSDDLDGKKQNLQNNIKNKMNEMERKAEDKYDQFSKSYQDFGDDVNDKSSSLQSTIVGKIEKGNAAVKDGFDSFTDSLHESKDKFVDKTHDSYDDIKGKAHDAKQAGQKKFDDISSSAHEVGENFSQKTQKAKEAANNKGSEMKDLLKEFGDSVSKSAHEAEDNLSQKAHNAKESAKKKGAEFKDGLNEFGDSVSKAAHKAGDNLDQKAQKAKESAKKKGAEFKDGVNEFGDSVSKSAKNKGAEFKDGLNEFGDSVSKSAHEAGDNLSQKAQKAKESAKNKGTEIKDGLNEFGDSVSKSAHEAGDNLSQKAQKAKESAKNKGAEIKDGLNEFGDTVSKSAHEAGDNVSQKAQKAKESAKNKGAEFKDGLNEFGDTVSKSAHEAGDNVSQKAQKAKESAKNKGAEIKDGLNEFGDTVSKSAHEAGDNVSQKAQKAKESAKNKGAEIKDELNEFGDSVSKSAHDAGDNLSQKTQNAKTNASNKSAEIKEATLEKLQKLNETLDGTKQNAQKEMKQKSQEGKNFFSGLVESVFGEKDKLHDDIHQKVSEGQEYASNAAHMTSDKQEDFDSEILQAQKEFHDAADALQKRIVDGKDDIQKRSKTEKDESLDSTRSHLEKIRQEAELTTDEIKRTAEETLNAAGQKQAGIQSSVSDESDRLVNYGKDNLKKAKESIGSKVSEFDDSSNEAFDRVHDSALSSFDKFERSSKDKVRDAQDTWEDLQSSTKDTFADLRDDVHGLESSAQDTLHSFQSSAGNTFDSLDDSAKEFVSGAQTGASNTKDFFNDMGDEIQSGFEGFKVSADNKLEDVKCNVKELSHDVSAKVGDAKSSAAENVQQGVDAVGRETDKFTSNLNNLGNEVFGTASGFMNKADASTKLMESEKSQSSPHKKGSGIPKLKKKKK